MRFRTGKIAIMADIEQMFHQVRVCKADRDSLRFLWRDLDETKTPSEYQMAVHVFGAVDSPCCANYALQRTARDQQGTFSEDVIHAIQRNFYMDDLLASKQSSDEATVLAKDLIEVLKTGGFRQTAAKCLQQFLHLKWSASPFISTVISCRRKEPWE